MSSYRDDVLEAARAWLLARQAFLAVSERPADELQQRFGALIRAEDRLAMLVEELDR